MSRVKISTTTTNLLAIIFSCAFVCVLCGVPNVDFAEAIHEIELQPDGNGNGNEMEKTVSISSAKLNFNNMIINMKSRQLTDITLKSSLGHLNIHLKSQSQNPVVNQMDKEEEEEEKELEIIQSSDFLKDCGRQDKCPSTDKRSVTEAPSFGVRSASVNYKANPYLCRCDVEECTKYGDCCSNISIGLALRTETNPWKCKYFPEKKEWVLMVSECPRKSPSSKILSDLCATRKSHIPAKNYTYLMDIPVYSQKSKNLYRNIYCARCHREKNTDLVHWKTRLYCNSEMTHKEQQLFIESADYVPGERYFQVGNRTCGIFIANLLNNNLNPIQNTTDEIIVAINPNSISSHDDAIPNIRYCGRDSIDSCPDPNDPHSQSHELDFPLSKDARLCSSYTQHVRMPNSIIYKNPHCARCNGIPVDSSTVNTYRNSNSSQRQQKPPSRPQCYRHLSETTQTPFKHGFPHSPTGPQGISLLFDFALDSDEVLVGYDNLCAEDEIWDYLHKRCQMAVCQQGYFLHQESCHPILVTSDPDPDKNQNQIPSGQHENKLNQLNQSNLDQNEKYEILDKNANHLQNDKPINSTCMRILLFEGEYSFISPRNSSIVINSSTTHLHGNGPIIFHPEEYEHWNETTLAVCAKHLHEGFAVRFSSVLNYISTVSLAISVIFSFLHILIYLSLPKLRNLPGRNLFCLTICLFISQLFFLTLINHSKWPSLCVAASITMHYTFLASFFWMQIMSFDIWRTFSGAVLLSRSQSPERKCLTFRKYSLFAWITPLFIVSIATLVEFLPQTETENGLQNPPPPLSIFRSFENGSSMDENHVNNLNPPETANEIIIDFLDKIKPAYGQNGFCWFGQRLSLFIFFAVPVALVITSNIVLFSFTAKAILTQNKEAGKVLQNQESKVARMTKKKSTCSLPGLAALNPNSNSNSNSVEKQRNLSSPNFHHNSPNQNQSQQQNQTQNQMQVQTKSEDHHPDQIKVKLYAKLALIMGLSWALGFISRLFQWDWLQHPFVILNGLQGTFIFFAFDFKWKIWRMLREKYRRRFRRLVNFCSQNQTENTDLAHSRRRKWSQGISTSTENTRTSRSTSFSKTLSILVDK